MQKGNEFMPAVMALLVGWLCLGLITSIVSQQRNQPLNQTHYGKT